MINFTLTDLRYLVALAEEQHFAKAAQKCFISQPTLSIAIKKLEENLGLSIFERENHRVITTPAGNELITQAHKILREAQNLAEIAESNQNPYKQPLKIGAILTIGPYLFPQLIQQIMVSSPKLQLVVEESYTDQLLDKLLQGEVDVILLATKVNHPELEQIDLFEDKLSLICSNKHKLAKLKKITKAQMESETFLLLGTGNCFRDQVLQVCPSCSSHNNQLASLISASSLETIKYMVAMNIGISILPEIAQKNLTPDICVKPFSGEPPSRTISLVYRKNFARTNLLDTITQILQK